jgi:arylsulfatase A-like enzyme
MKALACLFMLIALTTASFAQRTVIVIIADDWGTDYCGFYEDHQDTLVIPTIRGMVDRGVRFQNAMSNSTCSPTRAGILTGRYSFRTGVGWVIGGDSSQQLHMDEITIPRMLHTYDTTIAKAQFGKWHLHPPRPESNYQKPTLLGYDTYAGNFSGVLMSYYRWNKISKGVADTCAKYATSDLVDDAVAWIGEQGTRPCFLWLGFNAPHTPLHLPPKGLYSDTTLSGTQADIMARPRVYYKAVFEALDNEIGRLRDSLRTLNRLDSTDFIIIGDNGTPDEVVQIPDPTRAKGTVYQYGVHVPFIVSGPSVVNPGRATSALVNTVDIFATVMDLFGFTDWQSHIPSSSPVDSKSTLPVLRNVSDSIRPWAFTEQFKAAPDARDAKAIRNLEYKLIRYYDDREELFDVAHDGNEVVNRLTSGSINATDISNYNWLCSELTALVGAGSECKGISDVRDARAVDHTLRAYPNPFSTHLNVSWIGSNSEVELVNALGQVLYCGRGIDIEDLSSIPTGVYVVRDQRNASRCAFVTKQ